jgi:hypothetical protein
MNGVCPIIILKRRVTHTIQLVFSVMNIKFLRVSANRFLCAFSILVGLVWGYSIACHFLDFYLKSWGERGLVLLAVAAIAGLHAYKLGQVSLPRLKSEDYTGLIRNAVLLTGLGYVLFPALLPVFPMTRKLEIATIGDKNLTSSGSVVEITSIRNNNLPIQYFILNGEWEQQGDTFRTTGIQPASLSYAQLLNGRPAIQITFRTSPNSGRVTITWDGVQQKLDLYSAVNSRVIIDLTPDFPWNKLGLMRQAFLLTTVISDFLGLSILILAIETWLVYFTFRFKPSQYLVKAGPVILVLFLLVSLGWNIFNLSKSKAGLEILRDPQTSNRLDELLARSNNFKQVQIYTNLAEIFPGRSLIISPNLMNKYNLDPVQFKVTGRLTAIKQKSYPIELTDTEAQQLLKLDHRDLVYSTPQQKYTFITQPSGINTPLCMKTYLGTVFIGPVDLIPGCKDLP